MTIGQIIEEKRRNIPKPAQLIKEYNEFLSSYKTVAAKKTAMTREIKEQMYFVNSLQESFNRHKNIAWHHGITYNQHDIKNAALNLNLMFKIKNEIK
jgi:hypothetical protein